MPIDTRPKFQVAFLYAIKNLYSLAIPRYLHCPFLATWRSTLCFQDIAEWRDQLLGLRGR